MKKLLAAALAIVTACAALAACGDSDSSSKADETASKPEETTTTTAADESVEDTTTTEATTSETESEAEPEVTTDIAYDPEATETVFEFDQDTQDTGAWANSIGVWFDSHTFPADTDLTFTVQLQLTDTFVSMIENGLVSDQDQIGFIPSFASPDDTYEYPEGWGHFGEKEGTITADFPIGIDLLGMEGFTDGTYKLIPYLDDNGEQRYSKKTGLPMVKENVYYVDDQDETNFAPYFMKPDGMIKVSYAEFSTWGTEPHDISFTVTKDAVNAAIKDVTDPVDPEQNYGGVVFQCAGNAYINKVTINAGNILTNTQYDEWIAAYPDAVWGE
ncbi:MAG: hypothetical protein IJ555_05155 [Ruminococcus sp.]|nr:hypothetical protein [Ruminococcus sp.]